MVAAPYSLSMLLLLQVGKLHKNQPYDESLEIPDAEEVASQFSPTPRVQINKGALNLPDACH